MENAVSSKLWLAIVVISKYLHGHWEHLSELFLRDTCTNTSMWCQDIFMECNETRMVNGSKVLQSLKVQSWVYLDRACSASLLSSSGSGRGHSQSGCHLHWLRLSNATCHPEKMAWHLGSEDATVAGWGGYWDDTGPGNYGLQDLF